MFSILFLKPIKNFINSKNFKCIAKMKCAFKKKIDRERNKFILECWIRSQMLNELNN